MIMIPYYNVIIGVSIILLQQKSVDLSGKTKKSLYLAWNDIELHTFTLPFAGNIRKNLITIQSNNN